MFHDFGNNLEANLEVFHCAEHSLRKSLDEYFTSENHDDGSHWIDKTDMAVYENETIRMVYLAWREARLGIDSVLERITEKNKADKST